MGRQNQFAVTLTVGTSDLGVWAALEGGGVSGDPTMWYPGAMRPPVSLGADVETGAVTLRKLEDDLTDDQLALLLEVAGSDTECVASRQRLDGRNAATRRPIVYRGTLSAWNPSDVDASSNDPALIEIVLAVTGKPTLV